MEKIKVNMTPIEEVKTIHASQNDNATRKWAFDLYDENGKIDSSDIKEQMIFDSKVGGTEQILPENTSNPTTSPIIADIQYPDALRSEQEFLYRKSPATVDGKAKITKIKGNTLVWNQQLSYASFASNELLTNNNDGSIILNGSRSSITYINLGKTTIAGHKYYLCGMPNGYGTDATVYLYNDNAGLRDNGGGAIGTATANKNVYIRVGANYVCNNIKIIPQLFDLTEMGLDYITSVDQFTSLFSLSYYDYTTGKLLPFVGTELKTTGKNLFKLFAENKRINNDGSIGTSSNQNLCRVEVIPNAIYTFSFVHEVAANVTMNNAFYDGNDNLISKSSYTYGSDSIRHSYTFTTVSGTKYFYSSYRKASSEQQIEIGSTVTDYEPYTENTLSLPTLDYFPTGMKSAGTVYDELTESKAITRVGSVDLGSLDWTRSSTSTSGKYAFLASLPNIKTIASSDDLSNIICSKYSTVTRNEVYRRTKTGISGATTENIFIYDPNYEDAQDATAFKASLSGQYLYFELATPTEESITTASLVTEKGETPLYYDDELIAGCNETISSESGIFDAKIKLMTDETIYSQKIQLHVEPKP